MGRQDKRSPVEGRVPRQAGESGRERLRDLMEHRVLLAIAFAAGMWVVIVMGWIAAYAKWPFLGAATFAATAITLYLLARLVQVWPLLRNLKRGTDGEIAVGRLLDRLIPQGCVAFHDIVGDGFNIDHVVIGFGGVFVIETKTISKRDGENKVEFDGHQVRINGALPDRDPVAQVRRNAEDIRRIIRDKAGIDVTPRTIVVFPGWYVESKGNAWNSGVWVLNEKAMVRFISTQWWEMKEDELRKIEAVLWGLAKKKKG